MIKSEASPSEQHIEPAPVVNREIWQDKVVISRNLGEAALSNLHKPLTIKDLPQDKQAEAATGLLFASDESDPEVAKAMERVSDLESDYISQQIHGSEHKTLEPDAVRTEVMNMPVVRRLVEGRDVSRAHDELGEALPRFKELFSHGVHRGVELGFIPKTVIERLDDALSKTSFRIADAAALSTVGNISAYYHSDRDEVGIRHDIKEVGEDYEGNLAHEVTHKLSGGTFFVKDDEAITRPRVGFSTEMQPEPDDKYKRTGLNEAITQHVSSAILTGDFETLDPDKRDDGDSTYYKYRKIVGAFIEKSGGQVDLKTVFAAYFEDSGTEGSSKARRKFIKEVKAAYGKGALHKLDKLCDLSDIVNNDRLDEVILSRIHPPEVDDKGRIIKPGMIDTDNLPTLSDLYGFSYQGVASSRT